MSIRNYRIEIEYDGSSYQGWQRQKNQRNTIQEVLETTLSKLLNEKIKIIGAGRTDAGVHAVNQTANFKTSKDIKDLLKFLYSFNSILPEDITVKRIRKVADAFHSRYDAISREYFYQITTKRISLYSNYYFKLNYKLDFSIIDEFINAITGYKSFKSLCKNHKDKHSFKCNLTNIEYKVEQKKAKITFKFISDRYLHSMIRAITGCLIDLGRKHLELQETINKFNEGVKIRTTYLPAKGLFLNKINYK